MGPFVGIDVAVFPAGGRNRAPIIDPLLRPGSGHQRERTRSPDTYLHPSLCPASCHTRSGPTELPDMLWGSRGNFSASDKPNNTRMFPKHTQRQSSHASSPAMHGRLL